MSNPAEDFFVVLRQRNHKTVAGLRHSQFSHHRPAVMISAAMRKWRESTFLLKTLQRITFAAK